MLNLAVAQRAQYFDINGEFPLSGGRVTYYDVGTTTPKPIYADPYGNIQLPNPLVLDIGGFVPVSGVFYGEGNYTILVESLVNPGSPTPVWAEEYTIPDVPGSIISSITGTNVIFITSVEEIQNLTPNQYDFVYCQQYYNSQTQDQGGGWFRWYPNSTAPTNLGTVIATLGSPSLGRYIREFTSNEVSTAMFGVVSNTNTNMVARIQEAAVWANANKMTLVLSPGDIQCQGDFAIDAPVVRIEAGFKLIRLVSLSPTNMTINASEIDVQGLYPLCTANTNIYFNSKTPFDIYPQWFGSVGDGYTDDYSALKNATESQILSPNARIVITNPMRISATGNPGTPEITLSNVLFYKNSYIENWLTQSAIKLTGTVELEDGAEWVLRAVNYELDRYAVIGQVAHAHWFFNSTPNFDEFVNTCKAITNIGTVKNTLIWDFPTTYSIPNIGVDSICKLVTHEVGPNTKLSVTGAFSADNGTWKVSWFADDISGAIQLASFNDAWVDGQNIKLTRTSLTIEDVVVSIKDIDLTSDINAINSTIVLINSTINGAIASNATWQIDGCRLNGSSNELTFVGSGKVTIINSFISLYNKITIGADGSVMSLIRLQNNEFDGIPMVIYSATQKTMIQNNMFRNLHRDSGADYAGAITIYGGSRTLIQNNFFDIADNGIGGNGSKPVVLKFVGTGGDSVYIVTGLQITGNDFSLQYPSLSGLWYCMWTDNYNAFEHEVIIDNNNNNFQFYPASQSYTFNQAGPITSQILFFPYQNYPTRFSISGSPNNNITSTLTSILAVDGRWMGTLTMSGSTIYSAILEINQIN